MSALVESEVSERPQRSKQIKKVMLIDYTSLVIFLCANT
jgi:hypothetical protein